MFSLIESAEEIAKAQHKLEASIRRNFKAKEIRNIGYPSGTIEHAKVYTDKEYYWHSEPRDNESRYLNFFGRFKPNGNLDISVEANIAYEGRKKQVAGFFARDTDSGSIYLIHSGRVGGGTKGVGKVAFLNWLQIKTNQRPIDILDSSGSARKGILVMPIEGMAVSRSAIQYIKTIDEFKNAVRAGDLTRSDFRREQKELQKLKDFFPESPGRRKGLRSREIDYLSRHGEVVDALSSWRKLHPFPKNGRMVKNTLIDMGVAVGDKLVEVFEIKTSTARSYIYTAIGQIMVHGTSDECRRVLVLPEKERLASGLLEALHRLNIKVMRFKLDEKNARIL